MSSSAISVERVSKSYRVATRRADTLVELFSQLVRRPLRGGDKKQDETFWALRDVSFEVQPGEVVGIIGRNGAGKSTLLKVLSRITSPTSGRVVIRGRVASLLEVGTGFHPELTGRDNVYMNGSILGMRRAEIDQRFDEIVAFAGVERFLDTPLKRYSSGMQVRLAFAVAAHLEPEILIVDEVLAVGDAEFQEKCLKKMQDVSRHDRTVLFVSHNMDAVRHLCKTAILLEAGGIAARGACGEVIERYLTRAQEHADVASFDFESRGADAFHIQRLECLELDGTPCPNPMTWQALRFRFTVHAPRAFGGAALVIRIDSMSGASLFVTSTQPDHTFRLNLAEGTNQIDCIIERLMLSAGSYALTAGLAVPNVEYWDEREVQWRVHARDVYGSGLAPGSSRYFVPMDVTWTVEQGP